MKIYVCNTSDDCRVVTFDLLACSLCRQISFPSLTFPSQASVSCATFPGTIVDVEIDAVLQRAQMLFIALHWHQFKLINNTLLPSG